MNMRKEERNIIFIMIFLLIIGILAYIQFFDSSPVYEKKKIVAFCGAASKPVMEEAALEFEKDYWIEVELHFSGSGTMLSQMKISKTGDLYIPGSHDYMLRAMRDEVVDPDTIEMLAFLVPQIIVQEGNPKNIQSLEDLAKPEIKVGIGDPISVCVGEYAVELLEYNELYESVEPNIVVHAESCSKTAALVTAEQVDAIIGWGVFAKWNPKKTDAVLIKPERIPKIACIPGAISVYSTDKESAQKFLNFLYSEGGQQIFRKYGYLSTIEEARIYAPLASTPEIVKTD